VWTSTRTYQREEYLAIKHHLSTHPHKKPPKTGRLTTGHRKVSVISQIKLF